MPLSEEVKTQLRQDAEKKYPIRPFCIESAEKQRLYREGATTWAERYHELAEKADRYERALKDIASGKVLPGLIAQQALHSPAGGEKEEGK